VFLAHDTRLDRPVALKILSKEFAQDPERLQRFLQEAKLASALSHPNVAYIYEIGEADGTWFLAMEYVEGTPLSARVAEGPLSVRQIIQIGIEAADALDSAHAKGIIHRDIKPANLMLTPRGHVKILDFGLAKIESAKRPSEETQLMTTTGLVLGTVQYMSPEQALGREVDARTDIFSLGVALYEMATGRLPFAGGNAPETMARILHSQPDAIARFNYDLPVELELAIRKCLEKDRERRYQSARDLVIDLKNLERDSNGQRAAVSGEASRPERGGRIWRVICCASIWNRLRMSTYCASAPMASRP
jgi:serine/threonine protein kinase